MQGFLQDLRRQVSLAAGRGQTKSKWLNLTGYQFRYRDPRVQAGDIQAAIDYLVSLTGWKRMVIPTDYREIPGVRNCHERDLADFIVRENIFSYAIPNSGVINFTSFEDL
jgi:microsomal dipeptidase-like Zn-dependent dipeptidase